MRFRKSIYESFADRAACHNISWVILHGVEGYPHSIGRDLDVTCASERDERHLLELFKVCLEENNEVKWIVRPSPIWGKRLLGISQDYDVAELHIMPHRLLRMGNIRFESTFQNTRIIGGRFPVDPFLAFAKGIVMPMIAGDDWSKKGVPIPPPEHLPFWLRRIGQKLCADKSITQLDILGMAIVYAIACPYKSINNLLYWITHRSKVWKYPTTPLIMLGDGLDAVRFDAFVSSKLGAVFLDVVCGNKLSPNKIAEHQARQHLVYLTKSRRVAPVDFVVTKEMEESDNLADNLVDWFVRYNKNFTVNNSKRIMIDRLMVVFLGSDGSGKSSVIEQISNRKKRSLVSDIVIHLRPSIGLRKGIALPVTNPHRLPPRSKFTSLAKLVYFLFDYNLGYLLKVLPTKRDGALVVFDRYYHDILVDPKRYRYGGPMWLARWVGKIVPKPDLFILLDAPPEVLQARKQEVPFDESTRQREAYLELVCGMKNGVVVDASKSLNDVVAKVNKVILDFRSKRTRRRLGY